MDHDSSIFIRPKSGIRPQINLGFIIYMTYEGTQLQELAIYIYIEECSFGVTT